MLDVATAKVVKLALDKYFKGNAINLEMVCKMQTIPSNINGYTILALQYSELTVLVRIKITDKATEVVEIKTQEW